MAIQKDAPYAQSRAALRSIYGTRAIDASAPQSARDSTPSGRTAYLTNRGVDPTTATRASAADFKEQFKFRLQDQMQPRLASQVAPRMNQPVQDAQAPNPFDGSEFQNAFQQSPLSLIPPSPPAEELAAFLPTTTGPLDNFSLPKTRPYLGGLFAAASKWRAPL